MTKRLELLITSSLIFSGCSLSIQNGKEYVQYIKDERIVDCQRADPQGEHNVISPLIILKFGKKDKEKIIYLKPYCER